MATNYITDTKIKQRLSQSGTGFTSAQLAALRDLFTAVLDEIDEIEERLTIEEGVA